MNREVSLDLELLMSELRVVGEGAALLPRSFRPKMACGLPT